MSRPVFIIGCPRSGTSALAWSIAQHPRFWTSAESDFIHYLFGKGKLKADFQLAYQRPDVGWLKKHGVSYDEFCQYIGSGIDELFCSRSDGKRWVDATPGYTLMASDLARLFPEAYFLHIVRNGKAVVCSMLKSGFDFDWAKDFETACFTWAHYLRVGLEFEAEKGHRVIRVSHHRLVADTDSAISEIIEFLEEAPSGRPADFLRNKRVNSSYDNEAPEDIRKVKSTARLKERPWEAWTKTEEKVFNDIAGAVMHRAKLDD